MNRTTYVFRIKENWHNKLVLIKAVSHEMAIHMFKSWYGSDIWYVEILPTGIDK